MGWLIAVQFWNYNSNLESFLKYVIHLTKNTKFGLGNSSRFKVQGSRLTWNLEPGTWNINKR